MAIIYGLFDSRSAAQPVVAELTRNCDEHQTFAVQIHERSPLEADHLPEGATSSGRNTLVAAAAGAAIGAVAGAIAGTFVEIPGIGPGIMVGFGLLAGAMVGVLSAMMSGHRAPKPVLAQAATHLQDGTVLVLVVTSSGHESDWVEAFLDDSGGDSVGRC